MGSRDHRFRIGEIECVSLLDGSFNYPLESLFANVPAETLDEALRRTGLPTDHVTTPYTCLYAFTGGYRVLVDTGAGALGANASRFFPAVDHSTTHTGSLPASLRGAGVEPADVDIVIITHAHPDHVGGTLDERGALVFGNARYYISGEEWEFWMSGAADPVVPAPMVAVARRALEALGDRITLAGEGDEIAPGIRLLATPGHTPGHLAVSFRSGGEQLLHVADVVLHPLHLAHPEWVPVFDVQPEQAEASKRMIFDRAAREQALVFAHHFPPFPSTGTVTRAGMGWSWRPVEAPAASRAP